MSEELLDDGIANIDDAVLSKPWHPNGQRLKNAKIVFMAMIVMEVVSILFNFYAKSRIESFEAGLLDVDALDAVDSMAVIYTLVYVSVYITTIVLFLMWLRRAYYNVSCFSKTEHTDGWAVGWWFIPIMTLFKPYQIVRETFEKSHGYLRQKEASSTSDFLTIIGAWWGLWIINNIASSISNRVFDLESLESIKNSYTTDMYISIIGTVAAILCFLVLNKFQPISDKLEKLHGEPVW